MAKTRLDSCSKRGKQNKPLRSVGGGSKMDIGMQFHWEDDAFLDTLDTSQLLAAQMHIEQALARKNTGGRLSEITDLA